MIVNTWKVGVEFKSIFIEGWSRDSKMKFSAACKVLHLGNNNQTYKYRMGDLCNAAIQAVNELRVLVDLILNVSQQCN